MTILATPDCSQVLLIDPFQINLSRLKPLTREPITYAFDRLTLAALKLSVPIHFALSNHVEIQESWLCKPCEINKKRTFLCPSDRPVLSNCDLVEAMRAEDRMQLFICGFWLDDVVTATALEALPLGFDVRVITDLSFAFNDEARELAMQRFNQYTVAPMSLANLLYEWTTKAEDDKTRSALHQIWQEHLNAERRT